MTTDKATIQKADRAISDALTDLMMDATFYGAVGSRLRRDPTNPRVTTAATDGHSLFYSPDWILTLRRKQLVGLVAHEVMHIAMKHTLRRNGRNVRLWNIACDHAINNDLLASGFELPEDGCADVRFRGWSAEEVYDAIKPPPQPPQPEPQPEEMEAGEGEAGADDGEGDGEAGEDDGEDDGETGAAPGESDAGEGDGEGAAAGAGSGGEDETLPAGAVLDSPDPVADESEIDITLMQAGMCAKAAGNLPGSLARLINTLTRADVDWRSLLAEFLERSLREDYTMRKPNKRYMANGVYLPTLHSEATPEIAFFIDNSGSINDASLSLAVNALNDCIATVQPERVHVMCCDTRINYQATFERGETVTVDAGGGGGGTYFHTVIDALAADGIEPACAIYFTADACGHYGAEPDYPVLWMVEPGHSDPPWGTVVELPPARE